MLLVIPYQTWIRVSQPRHRLVTVIINQGRLVMAIPSVVWRLPAPIT